MFSIFHSHKYVQSLLSLQLCRIFYFLLIIFMLKKLNVVRNMCYFSIWNKISTPVCRRFAKICKAVQILPGPASFSAWCYLTLLTLPTHIGPVHNHIIQPVVFLHLTPCLSLSHISSRSITISYNQWFSYISLHPSLFPTSLPGP